MFCTRCLRATLPRRQLAPLARQISTTTPFRSAEPQLSTPVTAPGEPRKEPAAAPRSICAEGTVMTGLNYLKDGQDPVAKKDEEYPEWLWECLDVMKKADDAVEDVGDEFSKSKKERKVAAKRKRALEAKLLAEGNIEALAPKVPLHEQSVNLPGEEGGSLETNLEAQQARMALKRAMRITRKAKIKESNYLQSM